MGSQKRGEGVKFSPESLQVGRGLPRLAVLFGVYSTPIG